LQGYRGKKEFEGQKGQKCFFLTTAFPFGPFGLFSPLGLWLLLLLCSFGNCASFMAFGCFVGNVLFSFAAVRSL